MIKLLKKSMLLKENEPCFKQELVFYFLFEMPE